LADEYTKPANGSYVDMPNHLRERVGVVKMTVAMEIRLLEDGMDVRVVSDDPRGLYLQAVCTFDEGGTLTGEGLVDTGRATKRLSYGGALFRAGNDCIRVEGGAHEHDETTMRNDPINPYAINMTVNWITPADAWLRFRCFTEGDE
jgi:hypothetical protein